MLVSFAPIFPQPISISPVFANPEEQEYTSYAHSFLTDWPDGESNASDGDFNTYFQFQYSGKSGTKRGLDAYSFDSPTTNPTKVYGTLPPISRVDFKMNYNTSANLGDGGDKYRIVYYVSSSPVTVGDTTQNVTLVDWRYDTETYLNVNGFDNTWKNWTRVGASPYLGAVDYSTNYINQTAGYTATFPAAIGDFQFADIAAGSYGKVYIEIYARQLTFSSPDAVQLWLYDESATSYVMADAIWPSNNTWSWQSTVDVSSILDTTAKINNAKLYLVKRAYGAADNIEIDAMRLKVLNPGFVDVPTTVTWEDQPEPTNDVWDWSEIHNIRFVVETSRSGGADAGCLFREYEAWVVVYAPKAELRIIPENTTAVSPGSSFTININATDVLDLASYEFTITYNTVVLNCTGYSSKSPFTKYWAAFIDDPNGRMGMSYSMELGTTVGISGDKAVASVTFKVITTAGSLLDLQSIGFSTAKGVEIPHDVYDGYYNREAIPEFPLGMAIELALIAAVAYVWWKRRSKTKISKHIGRSSPVY